jgi:hypothetical protein
MDLCFGRVAKFAPTRSKGTLMNRVQWVSGSTVSRFARAAIGGIVLLCTACGTDSELGNDAYSQTSSSPTVGLYTPGNPVGRPMLEADGNYTEQEKADALLRNGAGANTCAPLTPDIGMTKEQVTTAVAMHQDLTKRARTSGSLSMTFTTQSLNGKWKPANVGAVWIADIQGRAVKTLEVWAAERLSSLPFYNQSACKSNDPDVIARATLPDHSKPHQDIWNGKDFLGNIVPDGDYIITIEVADVENVTAPPTQFHFLKGAQPVSMSVPDGRGTLGLQYTYTTTTTAAGGNTQP